MRNSFPLRTILLLVATLSARAQFQTVVIESKLADGSTNAAPQYSEVGPWFNSTAKSTATGLSGSGSRYATTNVATFSVRPTLAVAGGTYSVEVTQNGPASQSGDLVVGISQSGCTGLPTNTIGFQRTNANNWKWIGNLTLDEGVTEPGITFSYLSGTLNSVTGRFYSDSIRFIQQEQVIIESRGSGGVVNTNGYFELIGNWQNSSAKSSATGLSGGGSRFATTNAPAFKVVPTLLQPGGIYAVDVTQGGPASQSADIVIAISQTGCSGLLETTTAFQRSGANTWKNVGTIQLNESVTSPELTFTYSSGTLNSTNGRFYMDSIRFLRLDVPPAIAVQPVPRNVNQGSSTTFTASASGAPTLNYQWRVNGTNIAGATSTSLVLNDVQPSDAGDYSVVVTNAYGIISSTLAALTVNVAPTILTQPQSQTVNVGDTVTFNVEVGGPGPFTYQWRFNESDIPDATDSSYTRTNVQPSDAGAYSVVVSNAIAYVVSSNAFLSFIGSPVITSQPQSQTISAGAPVTFSVEATGDGLLVYQWRRNGANLTDSTNVSGANSASLTISAATLGDAGNYAVIVSNALGSVTSANARLLLTSTNSMVIVESALPGNNVLNTAPPYEEVAGDWLFSSLKSQAPGATQSIGTRFATTTNAAFKVTPALQPDKTYVVQITHGIATSVSANIVVSITQSNCSGLPQTTEAFNVSNGNTWETIGTMTTFNGEPMPEITFAYSSGNPNRFYADAIRFVDANEPCLSALPEIRGVTGPLVDGQTYVKVPGVSAAAAKISIFANGVWLAEKTNDITAGLNTVVTPALVKGQQITATQTDTNGVESCHSATGEFVGGGANPRVRVCLSIRMDTTLTGPIGASAGPATAAPLMMLGATRALDGFGTAPLGGRVIEPGVCWQTLSFLRGPDPTNSVDPTYAWFAGFGTNTLFGDFGVLDAITFSIDDLTDTGPYEVYIDDLKNGDTVIQDFEGAPVGTTELTFKKPAYSLTTAAFLISGRAGDTSPNTSVVTDANADTGAKSLFVSWQFGSTNASSWLRLNAHGNGSPFPMVDLRLPISFRLLLLPKGETTGNSLHITAQPQGSTNYIDDSATLSCQAIGTGALSYQWRFNDSDIPGATSSTLTLTHLQTTNSGNYSVLVQSPTCSLPSSNAYVAVLSVPPTIVAQPESQAVKVGGIATFSITADGPPPLRYQWKLNGGDVTGATESSYTKTNVSTNDAGSYSVVVANGSGSVTSSTAVLAIIVPPTITAQPQSQTVRAGTNVVFTAGAVGTLPLNYQWRFNGSNITGATRSSYTIVNVQPRHAGNYRVVVTNAAGAAISSNATLTVRLLITTVAVGNGSINPTPNVLVMPGSTQSFTATALANYTVGEWYLNGVRVQTGGTTFTLRNIQANATVKVIFRPIIRLYWQNATNIGNLEWRFNGTNYLGNAALPWIQPAWQMAGQSDFNNDGHTDLVYQSTDGRLLLRTLNGTSLVRDSLVRNGQPAPAGWKLKALSTLNSDGQTDFLFQTSTNRLAAWFMQGGTNFLNSALLQPYNSGWRVVGMADFNGDSRKDILWQNSLGHVSVWFMNGTTNVGSAFLRNGQPAAAGWNISALADMNYNGQKDILLQNSKGQVAVWLMYRTNYLGTVLLRNGQTNAPGWELKGPK